MTEEIGSPAPEAFERPRPSYWPFVLAVGLTIALAGLMINIVIALLGLVIAIVAMVGWGIEPGHLENGKED